MAHETLAAALAAFQTELPKLLKDEKAKVKGETKDGRSYDRSYGYADLAQVVETVLPVLGKHGLSVSAATVLEETRMILVVTLMHEAGELATAYWPLPDPRRAGPQDIGSAMTYGRRYLTLALTGTYPGGEDDDGAKAQSSARNSWDDARPARRQEEPTAAAKPPKTEWTDAEVRDIHVKMGTAALDMTVGAYDWMAGKGLHNRKVGDPTDLTVLTRNATEVLAERLADEVLKPDIELAAIEGLKAIAADRGLLKVQVSSTETLDQVIYEAHELAKHAAAEESTNDKHPEQ